MALVLVVDDLHSERLIAGGLLSSQADFSVETAENGVVALEKIKSLNPDLVLTDLRMPEMDGLKLVKCIREDFPLIPTILMTSKGNEDIAVAALHAGAASYVPKKRLADELATIVRRTLASARKARFHLRLMQCAKEMKFVLENDLGLISALVAHMSQDTEQRGICDQRDAVRVATALDEALLNAYFHGNLEVDSSLKEESNNRFYEVAAARQKSQPYSDRCIRFTAKFSTSDATFVIKDDGPGFNSDDLPDPTKPEYLERSSGRGLLLMKTFMDQVEFNEKGNEVTLIKRRNTAAS
ncbi:MAG: response regulator [Pirellulaceae bacterium]|nr:response regulator [Mariniblastus sp.]MDB4756182.1 response regulator [Mariniblastus sp.]MDG2470864.1 response regulator [Pirellulaceae bacterium]